MLRQSHFVQPVPLIVAQERGLLDRHSVKLETQDTRGSEQQLQQLIDGEIDLAVTAIDNLIAWNRRGANTRVIAQMERTTPLYLFGRRGVRYLHELHDARFGVDALGNGFAMAARFILQRAQVPVAWKEVGGVRERWQSLRDGGIDAALLGPPFDTFAEADGLTRIAEISELIPGYPGQGLVASRRALREKRGEILDYVRALREAVVIADETPEKVGRATLERGGFPIAAAQRLWTERPRGLNVALSGVRVVLDVRANLGFLESGVSVADLVDTTLVDSAV